MLVVGKLSLLLLESRPNSGNTASFLWEIWLPLLLFILAKARIMIVFALLSNLKCSLSASSSLCLTSISLVLEQVSFSLSLQLQQRRLTSAYILYSTFLHTLHSLVTH